MQVADNHELTTSATLGGKQAISFGISDDPAFFHVLSSSLYNNPNLAVVRETICNQWDAHIEAGLKHLPVLITIDEDNFIHFRDYGHGIPTSKIGAVYGTYGASTKKSNTNVTGGFGLGCKSPFAYTDSFQVTSWNQGKMSIYNVTKSSVETDGKPGIIPIVTDADTDQTGLEVKFQLRKEDINEFCRYIQSIVYNGEIEAVLRMPKLVRQDDGSNKVEMLDTKLPTLGMSFEPGSYNIDTGWHMSYMGSHAVFVRYGNVMYPATQSPATDEALGLIHNFMNIIGASRIVVQAAPSTLAIAPSRETLSNQKMTDDGIVDICVDLVDRLEAECKTGIPAAIKEIETGIRLSEQFGWMNYENYFDYITNARVRGYMASSLWAKQRKHHMKHWMNISLNRFFEQAHFDGINFNLTKAKNALRACRQQYSCKPLIHFLNRYVILPQVWKWKRDGLDWSGNIIAPSGARCYLVKGPLQTYLYNNLDLDILQLMRTKNVVITRRMSDCDDSFNYHPDYRSDSWTTLCNTTPGYYSRKCAHVIHVGPKKEYADKAVKKYTALGYRVIDLTQEHEWDYPGQVRKNEAATAAATRAAKKAALLAKGMEGSEPNRLVSVACVLGERTGVSKDGKTYKYSYISSDYAAPENWKRNSHVDVAEPVYYLEFQDIRRGGSLKDNPTIGSMHTWNDLTDEVKAVTVICRNKIEVNKAIKRGAIHLDDKRYKELFSVITTKEFKKYVTEQRLGFLEYLSMDGGDWQELLKVLGIKHKVLEGMVDKPEFNWAYNFLDANRYHDKEKLVSLGCMGSITDLNPYVILTHLKSFKHLQALNDLRGIFCDSKVGGPLYNTSIETVLDWVKNHPEDIPAYKTLIRNAITKRKGIYTR